MSLRPIIWITFNLWHLITQLFLNENQIPKKKKSSMIDSLINHYKVQKDDATHLDWVTCCSVFSNCFCIWAPTTFSYSVSFEIWNWTLPSSLSWPNLLNACSFWPPFRRLHTSLILLYTSADCSIGLIVIDLFTYWDVPSWSFSMFLKWTMVGRPP